MAGVTRSTLEEVRRTAEELVSGANFQSEGSSFYGEIHDFEDDASTTEPFVHFGDSKGERKHNKEK